MRVYTTICFLLFSFSSLVCYAQKKAGYIPPEGPGFNLVELFTSEGCSSCPAADKAMVQLAQEYRHDFYTLEFHVDYWNYLGWNDRYSNAAYTERQEHYGLLFHRDPVYTPQAVINGMVQEVGSDKAKMRPFLNRFVLREPGETLRISATAHMNKVFVAYTTRARGQLLNVALVQNKIQTRVSHGENKGRTLNHTHVVRDFKVTDIVEGHGFVEVYLPPGIVAEQCSVIAYTQTKKTWEVTSAAKCAISPENH